MNEKEVFYKEKESCNLPFSHIKENVCGSTLTTIDELFGAADVLSIQNANKHRVFLLTLSVLGSLLTFAFLLYDEVEIYGLILVCGVLVLCLYAIYRVSDKTQSHRKYLQYRVLAEALRLQFFLSYAGTRTQVIELMPWSVQQSIPWLKEVFLDIPVMEEVKKESILDCFIRDQKAYHEKALKRAEIKNKKDNNITKVVLVITVATYIVTLLFELFVYHQYTNTINTNLIRIILKLVLGSVSAITLFTGSYYGKMSLPNAIDDHKRMISLYNAAEERIINEGENEETILFLAKEFLNENSSWYAYQSKNTPEITI